MISPTKTKKKYCDEQFYDLVGASGTLAQEEKDLIAKIKDGFERNLSYNEVYRNSDVINTYKCWIYEGNQKEKAVGFKYLHSYPYDSIQFNSGDYIKWQYGGIQSTWLMVSIDKQHLYSIIGRIKRCNNELKWYVGVNDLRTAQCVIEDKFEDTSFMTDRSFTLQDGDIYITIPQNADTDTIKVNQRFLFEGQPFKVMGVKNFINDNTIFLTLYKDQLKPEDDLANNIADAALYNNPGGSGTYTEIAPNITTILQTQEQTYTVYKYVGTTQQVDTFTITASGIPSQYYTLTIVDGNTFKVKNNQRYAGGNLTVTCTNNITSAVTTIDIILGGLF